MNRFEENGVSRNWGTKQAEIQAELKKILFRVSGKENGISGKSGISGNIIKHTLQGNCSVNGMCGTGEHDLACKDEQE